jgi:hypothetical protein
MTPEDSKSALHQKLDRAAAEAAFWHQQAERLAQQIRRHRQNSAAQGLPLRTIDTRLYGVERAVTEEALRHSSEEAADEAPPRRDEDTPEPPRLSLA